MPPPRKPQIAFFLDIDHVHLNGGRDSPANMCWIGSRDEWIRFYQQLSGEAEEAGVEVKFCVITNKQEIDDLAYEMVSALEEFLTKNHPHPDSLIKRAGENESPYYLVSKTNLGEGGTPRTSQGYYRNLGFEEEFLPLPDDSAFGRGEEIPHINCLSPLPEHLKPVGATKVGALKRFADHYAIPLDHCFMIDDTPAVIRRMEREGVKVVNASRLHNYEYKHPGEDKTEYGWFGRGSQRRYGPLAKRVSFSPEYEAEAITQIRGRWLQQFHEFIRSHSPQADDTQTAYPASVPVVEDNGEGDSLRPTDTPSPQPDDTQAAYPASAPPVVEDNGEGDSLRPTDTPSPQPDDTQATYPVAEHDGEEDLSSQLSSIISSNEIGQLKSLILNGKYEDCVRWSGGKIVNTHNERGNSHRLTLPTGLAKIIEVIDNASPARADERFFEIQQIVNQRVNMNNTCRYSFFGLRDDKVQKFYEAAKGAFDRNKTPTETTPLFLK